MDWDYASRYIVMWHICPMAFSYNILVPIYIKENKYFISFNKNTTVFYWGYGNYN